MTDKKHDKHEDEEFNDETTGAGAFASQAESGAAESTTRVEIEARELDALKQSLAEAEAKSAENLDGWQRAVAEFQNYKKRMDRDREADKAAMKGDIIKRMLPVLDDLERALGNRPSDSGPWVNGIELIQKKLQSILESEGVTRIEAEGQQFDPYFHEAISHELSDTVESGRVIAVAQNGYMLGERVVRPALVRVAQ
jgi:molecular chaperone GrpE